MLLACHQGKDAKKRRKVAEHTFLGVGTSSIIVGLASNAGTREVREGVTVKTRTNPAICIRGFDGKWRIIKNDLTLEKRVRNSGDLLFTFD